MRAKATSQNQPKRYWLSVKFILASLLITFLIGAAKVAFEHHPLGHRFELLTYEALHSIIPPYKSGKELPVVVLDISKLEGGKGEQVTPREPLLRLIEAVLKENPHAVAVDIDFSITEQGWVTNKDPQFLDACLKLSKDYRKPIFLGIGDSIFYGPEAWLGAPQYQELAVSVIIPNTNVSRMPLWVEMDRVGRRLPTLSGALAAVPGVAQAKPPWLLKPAVVVNEALRPEIKRDPGHGYTYGDVLVNYSKLEDFMAQTVRLTAPPANFSEPENLRDRLVIIGDAKDAVDTSIVPGVGQPVADVYLHASTVYTLSSQPLYELTHGVRLGLDLLISLVIIGSVAYIRFWSDREGVRGWEQRQAIFISVAVGMIMLAGIAFVRLANVLWLDFVLVILALVLHPKVERWLHGIYRKLFRTKGHAVAAAEGEGA